MGEGQTSESDEAECVDKSKIKNNNLFLLQHSRPYHLRRPLPGGEKLSAETELARFSCEVMRATDEGAMKRREVVRQNEAPYGFTF